MLTRTAIVCASVAGALATTFTPSAARADEVAGNTLGPGDSYSDTAYVLNGLGLQPSVLQAFRFTAEASGRTTRIVVPIQHFDGENRYFFLIAADSNGIPGTVLVDSGPVVGFEDPASPAVAVEIDADRAATLVRGTSYWLVGACTETTQGFWHQNDHGATGARAVMVGGTGWSVGTAPFAAFRVEVAVTPGACPADFDANGTINPADVAAFVGAWFAGLSQGTLSGDFDNNGVVAPADVSLFVATWLAAVHGAGC